MRNIFLILVGILFSSLCVAQTQSIFPKNDLWKEDGFHELMSMTEEMFNKIIDIGYDLYEPYAEMNNETLKINRKWEDHTVNANVTRRWGSVIINMYGGLARRPEISPESFALVLCHELGHAYGGTPYISPWQKLSAEGQADFYGAKECLKDVIAKLDLTDEITYTDFMEDICDYETTCIRGLIGGKGLGKLLAIITKKPIPHYQTPDQSVVSETILSYPSIQCRLDSYLQGVIGGERPLCWYKP